MIIECNIFFLIFATIFILLMVIIIRNKKTIAKLKNLIKKERHRRKTPFLNLAIDRDQLALRLVNEGDIMAKNITIEDIPTIVDVGFQKSLVFQFKKIENLKPGDSKKLDVQILEKGQALPSAMMQRVGGVFISASFTAYIHCENMEGISFCTEIIKEGQNCKLSRVALAEKNSE